MLIIFTCLCTSDIHIKYGISAVYLLIRSFHTWVSTFHLEYSSPNIMRIIKWKRVICSGHVARMWEMRNAQSLKSCPSDTNLNLIRSIYFGEDLNPKIHLNSFSSFGDETFKRMPHLHFHCYKTELNNIRSLDIRTFSSAILAIIEPLFQWSLLNVLCDGIQ
jgi:hypothetical protein